jgi:hypothetical protein
MANISALAVLLCHFLLSVNSLQGLYNQHKFSSRLQPFRCAASPNDFAGFSLAELKEKSRSAGLPVSGTKKEIIERLSAPVSTSAPVTKAPRKLGGLLRRRPSVKAVASDGEADHIEPEETKVKEVVTKVAVQPSPVATKKQPTEEVKPATQLASRKELVVKTPTVEIKKVAAAPVSATSPVLTVKQEDIKTKTIVETKKPIKSVKQVVAAYDIDDDDFMSQFMDAPGQSRPQSAPRSAESTSSPRTSSDSATVATEGEDSRSAWPGPGVPWMSGPPDGNSKKDQNRGRNALMATADDDLQRMVDQRNDARYRRDYDGADAIREELRTIYRVEIYDKLGEWVAADGRWGLSNRKRGAGASEDGVPIMAKVQGDAKPCALSYEEIMDLVVKRTTARRTRQFQVADDIRNELARVGVEMFDKVNEWRTFDGLLRGIQSEDFEKYEVKKDSERYDRRNTRDNAW